MIREPSLCGGVYSDRSLWSVVCDSSSFEVVDNSDNLIRPKVPLDLFFFRAALAASVLRGEDCEEGEAGGELGCVGVNVVVSFGFMEYGGGYSDI